MILSFLDRQVWANSVDLDQTAPSVDQGLHCLPFHLHLLDTLLYCKVTLFKLQGDYSKFCWCPNF